MKNLNLKTSIINGVAWSAIEKFSTLLIQFCTTLFVARYVAPSDFGLIGMITIFIVLGQVLMESGFGQALIRKSNVTNIDYSSVFYLNIVIGGAIYVLLFFVSPLIARFYGEVELENICKIAFLVIPINAIGSIQYTILNKAINFKSLAKITIFSALLSGAIAVFFALKYKNVWALVILNLTFYFFRTLFLWIMSSWRPVLSFSKESIKEMYSFSSNLLLTGLISSFFDNVYSVVIGKLFSSRDLGFYSQADRFQKLPSNTITYIIQRVSFPVLSKIKDDTIKLKELYINIMGLAIYIIVPIMFFLSVISDYLFDILLPIEWKEASLYFKILCFAGALYPLHSINLNLLLIKGKGREILYLEIFRKVILLLILYLSSFYDVIYVVFGQLIYSFIVLFFNLYYCGRTINLKVSSQLRQITPVFFISFLMLVFVFYFNTLTFTMNSYLRLLLSSVIALTSYIVFSYIFKINSLFELKNIITNFRRKNE